MRVLACRHTGELMSDRKVKKLITAAIVGALYAALTMLLAPISYGPVQIRVSEVLCIMPFFLPYTSWGLFIGCAIANLLSAAGILDVVFGSLATLIACLCMAFLGKKDKAALKHKLLGCISVSLVNGIIVGITLTVGIAGLDPTENVGAFLIYAGQVTAGELAVMLILGLPLMSYLPRQKFFSQLD